MNRNYKFHNPEGVYFISFAVVGWLDVFTRIFSCLIEDDLWESVLRHSLILNS